MVRYRYKVARLTPRYFATALAVWPSDFIRFAVAMCSESSLKPLSPDTIRCIFAASPKKRVPATFPQIISLRGSVQAQTRKSSKGCWVTPLRR